MAFGWFLANQVAGQLYGPVARFWSYLSKGNLALGGGFTAWSLALMTDYRLFAGAATAMALVSATFYCLAVAGRMKAMEGSGTAPLNLANVAAVSAVAACYYFYAPFVNLYRKRGFSPSIFIGLVIVAATGLGYLLVVLFRRHREHARPADRVLAAAVAFAIVFSIVDVWYLLGDRPVESAVMAFLALVVVTPLAVAPLVETGKALTARPADNARVASNPVTGLCTLGLVAPAIHVISSPAYRTAWSVGVVLGAAGVISLAAAGAQRATARRADTLAARGAAVESLYEREAAKEAALLDILQRVSEGWGLSDIVEGSVGAVVQATSASRAIFLVVDMVKNTVKILGAEGLSEEDLAELRDALQDPYSLQRALRGGRTVVTFATPIPGLGDTSAQFGSQAFASTAISGWEEGGTAIICADTTTPGARFSEDDTRMMEAIADYVSLALSRMRLFRELAASEERYRVLVEESADGVVELDPEGRILFSNRAFAEMLDREPIQLLGESFPDLLGIPRWSAPLPGEVTRTTTAVKSASGEEILEIHQSTRRDGKIQAVVRNVTERHNYAQRLRELYEQLAEKERLRTQALSQLIRAEEETRSRIAADLHDGPVQEFSRLAIALDIAKRHLDRGDFQQGLDTLSEVRRSLSAEVLRLRLLMTELRPPVLEERGLPDAIQTFARAFENETGIKVFVEAPEALELDKSVQAVLYRIFQEAMANVKKHSFARHVKISLEESPDGGVTMVVSDDGVGFDPSNAKQAVQEGHIGIVSMVERAELAGGRCVVHGEPGQGTSVRVTIGGEVNRDAG